MNLSEEIDENFKNAFGGHLVVKRRLIQFIYRLITKKSPEIFMRGQDIISAGPQTNGIYEPEIASFIEWLVARNYTDFFVDIGANIGLTSCQHGSNFQEIHLYEPNPICWRILEVNTEISLHNSNYFINRFGLGTENKLTTLSFPRHNLGGGFVRDRGNAYSDQVLLNKDGYEDVSEADYIEVGIELKDAQAEFRKIFSALKGKGLTKGIIKIDVEGYEYSIIQSLLPLVPEEMEMYVIFESWDIDLNFKELCEILGGRAHLRKIGKKKRFYDFWPKFIRSIALLLNLRTTMELQPVDNSGNVGSLVIKINKSKFF
jgi:FkbM family methyltransferase